MAQHELSLNKMEPLRIHLGKSLTLLNLESTLRKYYFNSFTTSSVEFDLTQIEWVSLFELSLLIQWINQLSEDNKYISVLFPITSFIHGSDKVEDDILADRPIMNSMRRRQRVCNFLFRLDVHKEIKRIIGTEPIYSSSEMVTSESTTDISFDDYNDPHDARLLPLISFLSQDDIDLDKELSNQRLLKLLEEHSCLDPIDSGMLSNVVIEELASNAVAYGIKDPLVKKGCAWVSARLVKASISTIREMPKWYAPAYKALLGNHYVELAICDNGNGIFEQLKDHAPPWLIKKTVSIKAILNYAFDKYSSSVSEFRSESESLPRGLFWVYDLVRQYKGILTVRSSGYYMVYDFLTRSKHPRLLGLHNEGGACTDLGGTSIQIILPQSEGFFLATSAYKIGKTLYDPINFEINPPDIDEFDLPKYAAEIAKNLESLCQGSEEIPIIVDLTSFDEFNRQHMLLITHLIQYIMYFQNPSLIWIFGPTKCSTFHNINAFLNSDGDIIEDLVAPSVDEMTVMFSGMDKYDIKICPIILPDSEIYWLGATNGYANLKLTP